MNNGIRKYVTANSAFQCW